MSKFSYSEKLKNPAWQKKRLEILSRDNFTCKLCSDTETELHIHHKEYKSGKEPWEYEDDNFNTLCKHCHAVVEYVKKLDLTPLISAKYWDEDVQFLNIITIMNSLKYGLVICINRYFNDKLSHVMFIEESQYTDIQNIFNHAKKLL